MFLKKKNYFLQAASWIQLSSYFSTAAFFKKKKPPVSPSES